VTEPANGNGPGGSSSQRSDDWARWLLSVRLNMGRTGFALGAAWAAAVLAIMLVHLATGWLEPWVRSLCGGYFGLGPSLLGAFVVLLHRFLEGFTVGLVFSAI